MKQFACFVFFLAVLSGGVLLQAQIKPIELSVDQTGIEHCINALIEQPQNELLQLYPNPNSGAFTLKIAPSLADRVTGIEVFDETGRLIQQEDVPDRVFLEDIQICLEDIAAGTYFLKVSAGKQIYTRKFVIQNRRR